MRPHVLKLPLEGDRCLGFEPCAEQLLIPASPAEAKWWVNW